MKKIYYLIFWLFIFHLKIWCAGRDFHCWQCESSDQYWCKIV